jgi:vitamin B12/bleomycin/antimicrobial peptide transport system ATP-binding/permease protein
MDKRLFRVARNALRRGCDMGKAVLVKPLLWFLWCMISLIVRIVSFGAVDLAKTKINSSAVGHIWGLLWPYLVSTRKWPISVPKSITLPRWAFSGWRKRGAQSSLWMPLTLAASGFFLYHYYPAQALAVQHWVVPQQSPFMLWDYFLSSHFLTAVAACVALHLGLNALAGALIKSFYVPSWSYKPLSMVVPATVNLPWCKLSRWRLRYRPVGIPLGGATIVNLPLFAQAWILLGLIGFGCWAVNHVGVQANGLNGKLITAVTKKNYPVFTQVLWDFGMIMIVMTFLVPVYSWVKEVVILCWTKFCTALLLDEYADKNVQGYYAISLFKNPDNPNERIQQDLPALCRQVMIFLFGVLDAVITLWLFGQILWGIEAELNFEVPVLGQPVVIAHMMLSCLIIYAILGTNGAARVGKTLIGLNAEQRKLGAHFRVLMVMFEKYAEPIAAYRGEEREKDQLWRRFAAALANNYVIVRWSMVLSVFTGAYGKVAQFLPLLTLAPFYFAGKIEFGAISQSAGACAEILGALSLIVSRFDSISEMLAYGNRVGELRTMLAKIAADRNVVRPRIEREDVEGELLTVEGMDLYLPAGGKLIVRDFNLKMSPGQSVLIRGESGSGKTSMLRAIQGLPLWDYGRGKIRIAPEGKRMMLSQLAYLLAEGTLREQLLYPAAVGVSDEELIATLKKVNLSDLIERLKASTTATTPNWESLSESEQLRVLLDVTTNWDSLSGGERQRLVVARALVNKVLLVIADECTSGLDEKNEQLLYWDLKDAGITVLSVGHRASLLSFHSVVIELLNDGQGGWRQMDAAECKWS